MCSNWCTIRDGLMRHRTSRGQLIRNQAPGFYCSQCAIRRSHSQQVLHLGGVGQVVEVLAADRIFSGTRTRWRIGHTTGASRGIDTCPGGIHVPVPDLNFEEFWGDAPCINQHPAATTSKPDGSDPAMTGLNL